MAAAARVDWLLAVAIAQEAGTRLFDGRLPGGILRIGSVHFGRLECVEVFEPWGAAMQPRLPASFPG